ncbi:MAG: DNA-binding protein [Rhodospirillaceae bacterium]|nr:DNA-binding protein [Alphaproteobacteria bacterium]MBR71906.1 DNA-binding protein [Rhodospirillaceae bacterium]
MPAKPEDLFKRLDFLGIESHTKTHPAVYTTEEASKYCSNMPGAHCKTLFLKDKKGELWLVMSLDYRRINMKKLQNLLGSARLSFGKPDLLYDILGVKPGSVTPFSLINDTNHMIKPILDEGIINSEVANFHPLTNTMTTAIKPSDLKLFIADCGHTIRIIDLDLA